MSNFCLQKTFFKLSRNLDFVAEMEKGKKKLSDFGCNFISMQSEFNKGLKNIVNTYKTHDIDFYYGLNLVYLHYRIYTACRKFTRKMYH